MHPASTLTLLASLAMLLLQGSIAAAILPPMIISRVDLNYANVTPFPFNESYTPYLANTFDVIVHIPVSESEANIKQYLKDHIPSEPPALRDLETRVSVLSVANCVATIISVVASDDFPLARLLKIKQLIQDLGGAFKVATLFLTASNYADIIKVGGQELLDLANIFLGVNSIAQACFSL